jgi:cell division protein FtsB
LTGVPSEDTVIMVPFRKEAYMTDTDRRRFPEKETPVSKTKLALLCMALAAPFLGILYYTAAQVAMVTQEIRDTMPNYQRCRELAERIKAMKAEATDLESKMAALDEANGWTPQTMWQEADFLRHQELRRAYDALARRHNADAAKYYEAMSKTDMRFADPARLPPDAPELLPYWFYPLYIYGEHAF